jgi:phosphocarrier protein
VTTRSVTVVNHLGLHARAAAKFVHLASRFESQIRLQRGGRVMDGKSIMGILLLAAPRGTAIVISAEGPDEEAAVSALAGLVESGFGEPPASHSGAPQASAAPAPRSAEDEWNG